MAWFSAPPGSLFYAHWKRNGTNILRTITRPQPDTLLLYLPLHTDPTTWNRPLPDASLPHWFGIGPATTLQDIYYTALHLTTHVYCQPLKMELTQGSETSANYKLTPGKYPKEHFQYSNHSESLKSRIFLCYLITKALCSLGYQEPLTQQHIITSQNSWIPKSHNCENLKLQNKNFTCEDLPAIRPTSHHANLQAKLHFTAALHI